MTWRLRLVLAVAATAAVVLSISVPRSSAATCPTTWTWHNYATSSPAAATALGPSVTPGAGTYDLYLEAGVADTLAVGKAALVQETIGGATTTLLAVPAGSSGAIELDDVTLGASDTLGAKSGAAGASSSIYYAAIGYRPSCSAPVDASGSTVTASVPGTVTVAGTVTANQGAKGATSWPVSGIAGGGGGTGGTVDISNGGVLAGYLNNFHDDLFVLVGAVLGAALIPLIARWFLGTRG